uniref:Uncharacterized protein n=1 Tax=Oryza brachyantha TaxID=4533 RepID=J3MWR0_ORYBR
MANTPSLGVYQSVLPTPHGVDGQCKYYLSKFRIETTLQVLTPSKRRFSSRSLPKFLVRQSKSKYQSLSQKVLVQNGGVKVYLPLRMPMERDLQGVLIALVNNKNGKKSPTTVVLTAD